MFFDSGYMTCPPYSYGFNPLTIRVIGEGYKLWNFSLWSLLNSPFASLLDPTISITILFSSSLPLAYVPTLIWDHVSQPYSTNGNIIILYISILKLIQGNRQDKCVWTIKRLISYFKSTFLNLFFHNYIMASMIMMTRHD